MRISRGALVMMAAAGVGAFFVFKKKKAPGSELEPVADNSDGVEVDEEAGVIRLPETPVVNLPPELNIPQPPRVAPPVVRSPGFVPPPISNEQPTTPPPQRLPEIEPGLPDPINVPPIVVNNPPPVFDVPPVPSRPAPRPPAAPPAPRRPEPPVVSLPEPDQQDDVPDDTADVVAIMLEAESTPNWKRAEPTLAEWQESRGLTADGKLGPGTAKRMAEEIGTLPIIRFWPLSAGPNPQRAIDAYRNELRAIARDVGGSHGEQLRQSAVREKGQSFGPPTGAPNAPIALGDRIELDIAGVEA